MRFILWTIAIIGLILLLKSQFPYAATKADQIGSLVYLLLALLLVSGSGMLRRMTTTQVARDATIWLGIILALVLGYSFRGDLRYSRLAATLIPSRIQGTADGGLSIRASQDGHFHMEATLNNNVVNFLIDTGASDIVLSPQDARAAGFETDTLNYSKHFSTANGGVSGAPVVIDMLEVGPYTLRKVPASVNSVHMDTSLLGMSFLNQFKSYNVSNDTLTLYP